MSNYFARSKSYQFTINVDGDPEDFSYNVYSSIPQYITITQNLTNPNIFQFDIGDFPEAFDGTQATLTFIVSMAGVSDTETMQKILLSKQDTSLLNAPTIFGPQKKTYGTTISLMGDSVTPFKELGVNITEYKWVLPDMTIVTNKTITYDIPNDPDLIGDNLLFKCKAIDNLNNESDWTLFSVLIASDDNPAVVSTTWS